MDVPSGVNAILRLKLTHMLFLIVILACSPIFYAIFTGLHRRLDIHIFESTSNRTRTLPTVLDENSSQRNRSMHLALNRKALAPNENITAFRGGNASNIFGNTSDTGGKMPVNALNTGNGSNLTKWIHKTHTENKSQKANVEKKETMPNICELWPKELVGEMKIAPNMDISWVKLKKEEMMVVQKGGRFRPRDCEPREKTAIIIPYRDRKQHLEIILHHMHAVLQRQKIEYGIFVIEMAYPTQFNRGLLANVGFLTAASIADYNCYVIHDVDLIMVNDRNMYRCDRVPRHLTGYNSKFGNSIPYTLFFGGVDAFTPDQYWKVNGFSNLFFGWGGEDDDMVARMISSGMHFSRSKTDVGGYVALAHGKDSANPPNPHRVVLQSTSAKRKEVDGVRSVKYSRLALEFKQLYTWVYISAKEAKIMQKYQEYLQAPEPKDVLDDI